MIHARSAPFCVAGRRGLRSDTRIPKGKKQKGRPAGEAAPAATPPAEPPPAAEPPAATPSSGAAPFLVLLRGKSIMRELRLDRPVVTIGRGDESDAVVLEDGVSRVHARVSRDGDTFSIEDLGST